MLSKETVIKITEEYTKKVLRISNPEFIILYGSHEKGISSDNSDMDIAVITDELIGDYLEVTKHLYKIRRNISVNIEPILLISASDKSGSIDEVKKTGIIIYKRAV